MIEFLIIAGFMSLMVSWLLVWPTLSAPDMTRSTRLRTAGCILLATLVFPLIFYFFVAH